MLRQRLTYLTRNLPNPRPKSYHPHVRRFTDFTATATAVNVSSLSAAFPYRWLRDSCQCPACVHPSTRQKLHRSSDVPEDVRPVGVSADGAVSSIGISVGVKAERDPNGIRVAWASSSSNANNSANVSSSHESFYTEEFLRAHSSPRELFQFHHDHSPEPWTSTYFARNLAKPVSYSSLDSPPSLFAVLDQLVRYGLVFISGMPTEQTSDDRCELRILANRLGLLRNTFYGDVWDVRSVKNSKNIAYTNLDLGFHMDLMYFEEPPRYQILHCLRNRVTGGSSIFVDGLHTALTLSRSHPAHFATLATTPIPFHYINDGHHLHQSHCTFELRPSRVSEGEEDDETMVFAGIKHHKIASINYSPPFQAPLPITTSNGLFNALGHFASLLEDPQNRFEYPLKEGDVAIFDNRRVLHGRREFADQNEGKDGETNRWLKGCYLEEDAVLDKRRVLAGRLSKKW